MRSRDASDQAFLEELQERPGVRSFIGGITASLPEDCHFTVIKNGDRIGIVGVVKSSALDGHDVELICAITEAAQGNHFAHEACAAVIGWAVETRAWRRILACVSDRNPASRAVVERLGFRKVQRRFMRDEDVFERSLEAQPELSRAARQVR